MSKRKFLLSEVRDPEMLSEAAKRVLMGKVVKIVRETAKNYIEYITKIFGGGDYWDEDKIFKPMEEYLNLKKEYKDKDYDYDKLFNETKDLLERYRAIDIDLFIIFSDDVQNKEEIAERFVKDINQKLEELKSDNLIYNEKFKFDVDSRDIISEKEFIERVETATLRRVCEKEEEWQQERWKKKAEKHNFRLDMGDSYAKRVLFDGKGVLIFDKERGKYTTEKYDEGVKISNLDEQDNWKRGLFELYRKEVNLKNVEDVMGTELKRLIEVLKTELEKSKKRKKMEELEKLYQKLGEKNE